MSCDVSTLSSAFDKVQIKLTENSIDIFVSVIAVLCLVIFRTLKFPTGLPT